MFYIFHGDDVHSQQEALAKLQAKMGDPAMLDLNTTKFDGRFTFDELKQAVNAMPFLAKVRIVIIRDFFSGTPDKKLMDDILDFLPNMPATARLFFLESKSLRSNSAVLKVAEAAENGVVREYEQPKGPALEKWIRDRAKAARGSMTPQAAQMLAANIGSQLDILDNEITKLVLYKGPDADITTNDVKLLSPYAAEANIFDLVDALGSRSQKQASLLLQQKMAEGQDPFSIFGMITRQFRLLIQVKELADEGKRPQAIGQELKQHSYVVGKLYAQAQGFSLAQLEQIYKHLLDIDIGVKTGRHDMNTALDLLVAALTM
jgi:DNA polymerase-3 subunit delta